MRAARAGKTIPFLEGVLSRPITVTSHFFLEEGMEEGPVFELSFDEPPAKQARFATLSPAEVADMLSERVSDAQTQFQIIINPHWTLVLQPETLLSFSFSI